MENNLPNEKTIFLTSSLIDTFSDLSTHFGKPTKGLSLAFISTASEVEGGIRSWIYDDLTFFHKFDIFAFQYTLTDKNEKQLRDDLKDVDIICVAGGNVFYLLEQIHKSGFTNVAKEHIENGKIYIGESSGALATCPDLTIAHRQEALNQVPGITNFQGMNLVDITIFPHWGSDVNKEFYLNDRMPHAYEAGHKIILLTDKQYVWVKGDWLKVVEVPQPTPKPEQPLF